MFNIYTSLGRIYIKHHSGNGIILDTELTLTKALTLSVGELKQPVITQYQLGVLSFHLHSNQKYNGQRIKLPKNHFDEELFDKTLYALLETGVLNQFQNLDKVFSIIGKNIYTEEEVACAIDPFTFISHLSAMAYHGLTDRMPQTINLSSPSQKDWKKFATKRMQKDLQAQFQPYKERNLPLLIRIKLNKIGKKAVQQYSSIHLGAYKSIKNKSLRVATIGRTFLDMLQKPNFCGGMYHVINVFKEHAESYLKLIIDELDQHGKAIDKVRAGFILNEICNISHPEIDKWQQFADRGGSRKLDPNEEYSPTYSDKWCLSINIEITE